MTLKFDNTFYTNNRKALANVVPNGFIVLSAHSLLQQSADMAFPFHQDSNFWYLTGIDEPELILTIDTLTGESALYVPELNDYQKEWDNHLSHQQLSKKSGIKQIYPRSELKKRLNKAKSDGLELCRLKPPPQRIEPYGFYANPARQLLEQELLSINTDLRDIRLEIARLREIKQPVEVQAIRLAIDVTAKTLAGVKKTLHTFVTEKDVERAITTGFYANGSDGHAYEPIVASGAHASIIHYNSNDAKLPKNEMLLLDVGAKVTGYAADISRTWALGKVTTRHMEVFDKVYELQQRAYGLLKAGVLLREYQETMEGFATKALEELGVTPEKYPHGFSHFLGLDVHDAGDYDQPLQAGSVITVEPGLYLPDEGIGVRLEDNVLITGRGIDILSENIPLELL